MAERIKIVRESGISIKAIGVNIPDGLPCRHPGCLNHISHPCEGCGRIGGRSKGNRDER